MVGEYWAGHLNRWKILCLCAHLTSKTKILGCGTLDTTRYFTVTWVTLIAVTVSYILCEDVSWIGGNWTYQNVRTRPCQNSAGFILPPGLLDSCVCGRGGKLSTEDDVANGAFFLWLLGGAPGIGLLLKLLDVEEILDNMAC